MEIRWWRWNKFPALPRFLLSGYLGGRYIDVDINCAAAGRYRLNIEDMQSIVSSAICGDNVGEVVGGLARFPINVRLQFPLLMLRALCHLVSRGSRIEADVMPMLAKRPR